MMESMNMGLMLLQTTSQIEGEAGQRVRIFAHYLTTSRESMDIRSYNHWFVRFEGEDGYGIRIVAHYLTTCRTYA